MHHLWGVRHDEGVPGGLIDLIIRDRDENRLREDEPPRHPVHPRDLGPPEVEGHREGVQRDLARDWHLQHLTALGAMKGIADPSRFGVHPYLDGVQALRALL